MRCFLAFHHETLSVSPQIYLKNKKGRCMGGIMQNYIFLSFFFIASLCPLFPIVTYVIWKIIKTPSSSKLHLKINTIPKLSVLGSYFCHGVSLPKVALSTWRTSEVNSLWKNGDELTIWNLKFVSLQTTMHSAWRVIECTWVDAHIITRCLEKEL